MLPRRDLARVGLLEEIVNAVVKPVTIAVDMELLKVSEFIERVMLQIVRHDLILLLRLRFIFEARLVDQAGRFIWNVIGRIQGCMLVFGLR